MLDFGTQVFFLVAFFFVQGTNWCQLLWKCSENTIMVCM